MSLTKTRSITYALTAMLLAGCASTQDVGQVVVAQDRPEKEIPKHLKSPPVGKELAMRLENSLLMKAR